MLRRGASSGAVMADNEASYKVFVHDSSFSSDELLLHPETFPGIGDGSVVFLKTTTSKGSNRVVLRETLVQVEERSELEKFSSKRLELSLLKSVAESCGVAPWSDASVELCLKPEAEAAADFCEFWFKDQFVSRADMWRFKTGIVGRAVHVGKAVDLWGMRATVAELRGKDGLLATSALLVASTRFVFRTRSTRLFWLVQMSFEMWEPTGGDDGALHVERLEPASPGSEAVCGTGRRAVSLPPHTLGRQLSARPLPLACRQCQSGRSCWGACQTSHLGCSC